MTSAFKMILYSRSIDKFQAFWITIEIPPSFVKLIFVHKYIYTHIYSICIKQMNVLLSVHTIWYLLYQMLFIPNDILKEPSSFNFENFLLDYLDQWKLTFMFLLTLLLEAEEYFKVRNKVRVFDRIRSLNYFY